MIMGKTKWGLKPTSSSKAVEPKQKRLRRVKLSALWNYRGTTVTACIVSVKTKILAALQVKSRRINLFAQNIVENSEVSKFLIESSGENSLLYERPKLLMLQIGNKYPFDAWKETFKRNHLKELTPFKALEITVIQWVFVKTLQAKAAAFPLLVIL